MKELVIGEIPPLIRGIRELAKYANVHHSTVYRWEREGRLKIKMRVNRTLYFDPSDFLYDKPQRRTRKR